MGRADSVKLSGNLVAGHRYRKAAYDVPSKLVPVFARKWAIDESGNSNADSEPKKPLPKAVCEHKRLLRSIRRSKRAMGGREGEKISSRAGLLWDSQRCSSAASASAVFDLKKW